MKQKDKEYIQQCYLRMLTEGDHLYTEEQLQAIDQELGIQLYNAQAFCVVVKIQTESRLDLDAVCRLKRQCERIIHEQNIKGFALLGCNMDLVLLLKDYYQCTPNKLDCLQTLITMKHNNPVRLGVGRCYTLLSQINQSKAEAYEALAWAKDSVAVADVRDMYRSNRNFTIGIGGIYKEIIASFKQGNLCVLEEKLKKLAEHVRANTPVKTDAPYPTSIRRTMIELLVEMLHIASDAGVDVDAEIGYLDPYRKIFELSGTPAIIDWVVEVAHLLYAAMAERQATLENKQLELVKEYIQQHLSDIELSLSSASQFLGMSPSYFSAFFIREEGMGFKEYVTTMRLELAKKELLATKDSVNAVSERCGFLSASYFISVFKNQTGCTPGAYRKLKN